MSHTPGPWRYQKETSHTILGPSKLPPVVKYQIYKEKGIYGHPATCDLEADARLIAAAPELLDALEVLFDVSGLSGRAVTRDMGKCERCTGFTPSGMIKVCRKCAANQVLEVISKAKGEA